jgi:hypothetical protein
VKFLRPTSRKFAFDATCSEIVAALEARNFCVPEITVSFHEYGSGDLKCRMVERVRGRDFCLSFGRGQGWLPEGRWYDSAAVSSLVIPGEKLAVYADDSGPDYWVFVGDSWEAHRDVWLDSFHTPGPVHPRSDGHPRTCLCYQGTCRPDDRALLVADNDLGRHYDPEPGEPVEYLATDVFARFDAYLRDIALASILAHPEAPEPFDLCPEPEPVPFPENLGEIFCLVNSRIIERIRTGQADPSELHPADRYALEGGCWRLLSLDYSHEGLPEIVREGFAWCGFGDAADPDAQALHDSRMKPNVWGGEPVAVRIKPRRANDIYVVDHAAYERRRIQLSQASRFTDAEVGDLFGRRSEFLGVATFMRARARTLVPIAEYNGTYEKPIVLIGRELGFDEVELVGGAA